MFCKKSDHCHTFLFQSLFTIFSGVKSFNQFIIFLLNILSNSLAFVPLSRFLLRNTLRKPSVLMLFVYLETIVHIILEVNFI